MRRAAFSDRRPRRSVPVHLAAVVHGREGEPLVPTRSFARERAGIVAVQLVDPRQAPRLDDRVTVDLHADKDVALGNVRFTWSADVFNLFDDRAIIARSADLGLGSAGAALDTLPARTVRVGLRVAWR